MANKWQYSCMSQTLFDKYGGVPVVTRIVRDFYKRVMRRPNLRRYFEEVPLERLIHHQIRFVSMAMGKPPLKYSDAGLHAAHASKGITKASFDLMIALFTDALMAEDIEPDDIERIVSVLRARQSVVVTK
ncbi:MAG: group I truncated hemoglobin [Oxalobacteraceae bacterium]